jgi:hypothetical protein
MSHSAEEICSGKAFVGVEGVGRENLQIRINLFEISDLLFYIIKV